MRNLILHLAKPIRCWIQVKEQISSRHISRTGLTTQYFGRKLPVFFQGNPFETQNIRCRIQFCMQRNQLYGEHRSRNKFLLDILGELGQKQYFDPNPIFFEDYPFQARTTRCRIKFCIQHRSMEWMSGRYTWICCSLYWLHTCTSFLWRVLEICGTIS
jgi:hypothetical protein